MDWYNYDHFRSVTKFKVKPNTIVIVFVKMYLQNKYDFKLCLLLQEN